MDTLKICFHGTPATKGYACIDQTRLHGLNNGRAYRRTIAQGKIAYRHGDAHVCVVAVLTARLRFKLTLKVMSP